jgi:hypothetical protein
MSQLESILGRFHGDLEQNPAVPCIDEKEVRDVLAPADTGHRRDHERTNENAVQTTSPS